MDIDQILAIIPRRIHEWSHKDVELWLTYIQLPQLIPKFRPHRVDGKRLLKMSHEQLLSTFRIESKIIKKKVLNWIQYLGQWQSYCHEHARKAQMQNTPQLAKRIQKLDHLLANTVTTDEDSLQLSKSQDSTFPREIIEKDSSTAGYSCTHDHENLYVYERCCNENKFIVCDQTPITFGRSHQSSFFIVDVDVQPKHCAITHRQNRHYLTPSESISGVWTKINKKVRIQSKCIIEMGEIDFIVTPNRNILTVAICGLGEEVQKLTFDGLEKEGIKVGRRNSCDIIKPQDTTLSGYHGKFTFDEDAQWIFEDLQTTNGSWLRCLEETLVLDKMIFRIGKSNYIYESRIWMNEECKSISSTSSELGTCRNCRSSEKNCYFKPCHHNQFCYSCAAFMTVCPLCNAKIRKVQKIYKL